MIHKKFSFVLQIQTQYEIVGMLLKNCDIVFCNGSGGLNLLIFKRKAKRFPKQVPVLYKKWIKQVPVLSKNG